MNLNQLEYFVCAAETLNFTKAAALCYISQTAMTQQIRALEKTVGVSLFDRDKHHVELTAAGKVYLNEARAILERSNEAIRLARLTSEGAQGEVTIGFINGLGDSELNLFLKRFHLTYPNITVHLIRNNLSVLIDYLLNKECDLIFTIAPRKEYPDIQMHYLNSSPLFAVLPEGHSLTAHAYLGYSDLENENFIMMQPKTRPKDQMEESMLIYKRGGYLPNVTGIEGEQETLLLLVSAGMGVAILPEYIVHQYTQNKTLAFLPLLKDDGTAETLDICVSWHQDNHNPAAGQLLELLMDSGRPAKIPGGPLPEPIKNARQNKIKKRHTEGKTVSGQ